MDEVIFRSSQRIENLQIQVALAATKSKDVFIRYSEQSKSLLLEAWNSARFQHIRENFRGCKEYLINVADNIQYRVLYYVDPKKIYLKLTNVFSTTWTTRDICFGCAGLIIGGLIGLAVGLSLTKPEPVLRYMRAIQCNIYLGHESAVVVEDALAPYQCGETDVLITVKAGSVQVIDSKICSGYGKNIRRILQRIYKQSNYDLPVVLGRDCTGIVADLGSKVTRVEVGDEVWVTVPFWSQGTLCQSILVPETRVAKKPKAVGFEGGCSLPYAGSLALSALQEANITPQNAATKKILVQGGVTPVGCVLIQLLHNWNANITTTCFKRSAPVAKALGANEIITISEPEDQSSSESPSTIVNALKKELELKSTLYDIVFNTRELNLSNDDFQAIIKQNGQIVSTLPKALESDKNGFLSNFFLGRFIKLKYTFWNFLGLPMDDYDEAHLCHNSLEQLTDFVDGGYLQTVVDKVFQPHDIELALNHVTSNHSIGSTVISFR